MTFLSRRCADEAGTSVNNRSYELGSIELLPLFRIVSLTMRLLSILALLILQSLALGQEAENQQETIVRIPFACSEGETHTYRVIQTSYKNGVAGSAKTQILELEILSVDDKEIVCTMKMEAQVDEETLRKIESDPVTKAFKDLWDSLVFEVVMTPDGIFSEFRNIDEIEAAIVKNREMVGGILETMKPALVAKGRDPAEIERVFAMILKRQGGTQTAIGRILTPLNMILQFVATEYEVGKPAVEQTELDLGVVSELPATKTYRVTELNRESNLAVIQLQQLIEGQEAATKYQQGIDAMIREMKPDHQPAKSVPKVTVLMDSLMEGKMDLDSGWPQAVSWISKMNNLKDDQLAVQRKVEVQRVESGK